MDFFNFWVFTLSIKVGLSLCYGQVLHNNFEHGTYREQ